MFGLAYLIFFAAYLTVSILVIRWAVRHAKKQQKSRMLWGFVAAFIMYNLVFWDWIPTVVVHKYYCSTEAGFWVYKTLDQWKSENPGVAETLHYKIVPSQKTSYGHMEKLNERFIEEVHKKKILFLPTTIMERRLVDVKKNELVAKEIVVGSNVNPYFDGFQGYKFWLSPKPCVSYQMGNFTKNIVNMGSN
ncbi:hypothetical protein ACFL19_00045 [Pseudomonadota bacterium]